MWLMHVNANNVDDVDVDVHVNVDAWHQASILLANRMQIPYFVEARDASYMKI